ncbi:quinone oxidoreductase family protein [Salipiger abyssi]|uniref:NADPH2:quinone reductase n=1 Tax=Salipiger abyssi TaxID=1250539 RepID=A0A1P8UN98_9RHOB|nr:zinc-binding dehydrogenase [Salipiger abyssi]APZ50853.1 NADPH2:quinone reductase [Salipiger abyssi]
MKAAFYSENGGPEVLNYGEVDDPACGATEIAIDVRAISIEGGDLLHRRITPVAGALHVPGYQAAGIVSEVGAEVRSVKVGDRVVGFNWSGSHAERFVVPEHFAYPVPDGLDLATAATVPVAFGTAHDALFEFGGLGAGETVLIHGATGGVGIALVQLAKQAGATVIGTASSEDKIRRLAALGLDHGFNGRESDIRGAVMTVTGGAGADLALDLVGGPKFPELVAALRPRGRLVLIGFASGEQPVLDPAAIRQGGLCVTGLMFGKRMHLPEIRARISGLIADVAAGTFAMPIERQFALKEAAAAHRYMEQSRPFGKVVLIP